MNSGTATKTARSSLLPCVAAALVVAAGAATAASSLLSGPVFRARAFVAIGDAPQSVRSAAARSAADLAVSKPVIARAAMSLIGTDVEAPAPALAEKIGVVAGWHGATGSAARLAATLTAQVAAASNDGMVEITAEAADPARAAHIATALAEALVSEEDAAARDTMRKREAAIALRTDSLRAAARAAHARLASLGAPEVDTADSLAAASAATRAAETHLSAIRAVIASGTPPLGAGTALPQSVQALQTTYLDLSRQLATANETLGERHTTVLTLQDGVRRASAGLAAEWKRIARIAEGDLASARGQEAALRKAAASIDPIRRATFEEARRAAHLADDEAARAQVPAANAEDAPRFRLVAPAGVPSSAVGMPAWLRATFVAGAAAAAFAVVLMLMLGRRLSRREAGMVPAEITAGEVAHGEATDGADKNAMAPAAACGSDLESLEAIDDLPADMSETAKAAMPADGPIPAYAFFDPEPDATGAERVSAMMSPDQQALRTTPPKRDEADGLPTEPLAADPDLRDALRGIAADLETLVPALGAPPVVMVAANLGGIDTSAVALALGEAAAELGYRVLIIESERARADLAAAAERDGEPILVDAFGALRVALPAERGEGLFLAPAFKDGARIAAALARNTQAELVDDLASAFDAIVVDGGRAPDCAAAGWTADAFLRVGRFASHRDDEHFLAAFDAPKDAMVGTVAGGRFVPRVSEPVPAPAPKPLAQRGPQQTTVAAVKARPARRIAPALAQAPRAIPRRRLGAR